MREYEFEDKLAYSKGIARATAKETIKALFGESCVSVDEATMEQERVGIDWVVTLRRGAKVNVDNKLREPGCSKYWHNGLDLALEIWSVVPGSCTRDPKVKATGWTLDEKKQTDYTLHTFDPSDTHLVYLLPFQLLRKAFVANFGAWTKKYPRHIQHNTRKEDGSKYWSQCVFVPVEVIIAAINEEMAPMAL